MKILVKASSIEGEIKANPSKSHMQRAVALAALYKIELSLREPCLSEDCMASLNVAHALGNTVDFAKDTVRIMPDKGIKSNDWRIGESGFSARVYSVMASLFRREIKIIGQGSILKRSMHKLEEVLIQLGAQVQSNEGHLPFVIKGPADHFNIELDASGGSQELSALLMALPAAKKNSVIQVKALKSKPYIDFTLKIMEDFGFDIEREGYRSFSIKGKQKPNINTCLIEGDWSGMAFLLVAAAISGSVVVEGLEENSLQGDRKILEVLDSAGAYVRYKKGKLIIKKQQLKAFDFDSTDCPDLFPPLAVLACFCEGVSRIKGVNRLKNKESNRYKSLKKEFARMGIQVKIKKNWMVIQGGQKVQGAKVKAHQDHRIAMALAVMGLRANGPVLIDGFESISKSYPGFLRDMKSLGADYEELDA